MSYNFTMAAHVNSLNGRCLGVVAPRLVRSTFAANTYASPRTRARLLLPAPRPPFVGQRRLLAMTVACGRPSAGQVQQTLLEDGKNGFGGYIRSNPRPPKPRVLGVTEIRGPYYSAYGRRHLLDVLETMGAHVDGLKFAGGSFALMPARNVAELIDLAHEHDVYVSTVSAVTNTDPLLT